MAFIFWDTECPPGNLIHFQGVPREEWFNTKEHKWEYSKESHLWFCHWCGKQFTDTLKFGQNTPDETLRVR